ncbi:MAG TPA: exodeoxyribonuclease V subunit alpha [Ramlibacter sp.]
MSRPGENMQPEPGSEYERSDPSAERLAEGFAQHVERWARRLQAEGSTGGQGDLADPAHGAGAATYPPTEPDFALLRHAAHQTSLATSSGHVCMMLSELVGISPSPCGGGLGWGHHPPEHLRESLLSTRVVGTPGSPGACPLIVDEAGRLYLHRYFDYEVRLARRIMQAARTPPRTVSPAARELLNTLFPATPDSEVDWQKIAAALALRNTLTIISGGPGTGKTTTVVNLLACLFTQEPHSRIALAAPTGKAAARMTEAVRQRAGHLPADLRDKLPTESFTIHRLLGVNPGRDEFTHHAGNPLPYDALIVDEASMLDLALATRLLEAVPASARIILLGDKDQLAAVEAGAVFAELSADPTLTDDCRRGIADLCGCTPDHVAPPAPAQPSPLHDAAVWLTKNYRFPADSGIGRLARYINEGRAEEAMALLRESRDPRRVAAGQSQVVDVPGPTKTKGAKKRHEDTASLSLFPQEPSRAAPAGSMASAPADDMSIQWLDPQEGDDMFDAILAGYAAYFETVRRNPGDADAIFRAFNAFRVLCAVREGTSGSNWVNEQVTRRARQLLSPATPEQPHDQRSPWHVGRPVMVLRNDYLLKLFNGDIGIALPIAGELAVLFPDAEKGVRRVPVARMPPHETAFAITVHKAQGSEFDEVLLCLPQQVARVAVRELLYTAVTRSKRRAMLAAGPEVLARTMQAQLTRESGLLSRLLAASACERRG